jgi:hypothetical protein
MKTAKLIIDAAAFDMAVWNSETDFTQQSYNLWLNEASDALQRIYDELEDSENIDIKDLYILGDVINMLDTTKIIKRENNDDRNFE